MTSHSFLPTTPRLGLDGPFELVAKNTPKEPTVTRGSLDSAEGASTPSEVSEDLETQIDRSFTRSSSPGTPKMPSEPESGYASGPASPARALGKKGGEKMVKILAECDKAVVQQEGTADDAGREAPPARRQKKWIKRVHRLGAKLKP